MTYYYWYFFDVAERLQPFIELGNPRLVSFEFGVVTLEYFCPQPTTGIAFSTGRGPYGRSRA